MDDASKYPKRCGDGAIEGVTGPESAINAATQSSFIPLLGPGVPSSAVMGLVMRALMIKGLAPGPMQIVPNVPPVEVGSPMIFLQKPIAAMLLCATGALFLAPLARHPVVRPRARRRREAIQPNEE